MALKRNLLFWLFIWCVSCSTTVFAEIGVTDFRAHSSYVRGGVWSGIFKSYNGRLYNASNLYKQKNTTITMTQTFYYKWDNTLLFVPTYFDTGYKSDLFRSQPVFAFGFGVQKKFDNLGFELVARNLFQIGGQSSENPCFDSFKRKYHCGLGVAWSESQSARLNHDLSSSVNLVFKYEF